MSDTLFEPLIPSSWAWARTEDICTSVPSGSTPPPSQMFSGAGDIPFIKVYNLTFHGILDFTEKPTFIGRATHEGKLGRSRVRPGTVLMNIVGPPLGKVSIVPMDFPEWNFNQAIVAFALMPGVLSQYLAAYLQSPYLMRWAVLHSRATAGQYNLSVTACRALHVPIAPEAEQARIVGFLETQLSRLDAAVAGLKRVQANLKRYRASVLKAAVEGRLVPTEAELAKAEGRSYEPAAELLARILKERRKRWEEAELASMKAKGKPPKDNHWKTKYQEPTAPDTKGLPELPEGWCWASLGQLKEFSLYGPRFSSDVYSEAGTVVLRTTDISEGGRVDLKKAPRIELSKDDLGKYRVERGDLLVTRTGSIGTIAVFDDDVDAIPGAYLIQYRLATRGELPWFVYSALKSPALQFSLKGGAAGVGRPNLNAPTIDALPIPLPPSGEQMRILESIDDQMSVIEKNTKLVQLAEARTTRLRQAILKWAFEGKLVDQDPSDEPANALLQRIRAQREAAAATSQPQKRSAPKPQRESPRAPAPKPRAPKTSRRPTA